MSTSDSASYMRGPIGDREVRRVLRSLDTERFEDEDRGHYPDASEVGQFAFLWWVKGLPEAAREFDEVARHLRLAGRRGDPGPVRGPQIVKATCAECADVMEDIFGLAWRDGVPAHGDRGVVAASPPPGIFPAVETLMPPVMSSQRIAFSPVQWLGAPMSSPPIADVGTPDRRTFWIGRSHLIARIGSIVTSEAEVLVSSDDTTLRMGGGVSGAIRAEADEPALMAEIEKVRQGPEPELGSVVVTAAPGLRARYLFHAITLNLGDRSLARGSRFPLNDAEVTGLIVRRGVARSLELLATFGCRSIAFPVLGTGAARIPYEVAIAEMVETLSSHLLRSHASLAVEVVLRNRYQNISDEQLFQMFVHAMKAHIGVTVQVRGLDFDVTPWPFEVASEVRIGAGQVASEPRRRQSLVRLISELDARRGALEREQLGLIVAKEPIDPARLDAVTSQLHALRDRRARFEREFLGPPSKPGRGEVFLSSTYRDLRRQRSVAESVIGKAGLRLVDEPRRGTAPVIPRAMMLREIDRADAYVGILGWRYGTRDPATGLAYTELEYSHAVGQGKPTLIMLADSESSFSVADLDTDADAFARIRAFRDRVSEAHEVVRFRNDGELQAGLRRGLAAFAL
ncbi:MAG: DUF4062 domain-containing protein [Chloroflexi bacterium]|nr:DUF4062 domain-containing protein [Chloroflexota bacterium]